MRIRLRNRFVLAMSHKSEPRQFKDMRINPGQTKKTDDLRPRTIFEVFFRTESIFSTRPVMPCVLRSKRHQVKK